MLTKDPDLINYSIEAEGAVTVTIEDDVRMIFLVQHSILRLNR